MTYQVYILYSEAYDKFYIGQTNDIDARLLSHNTSNKNTYTSKYRPWVLFWKMKTSSRSEAMRIEKYLKGKNKTFYRRLSKDRELRDYISDKFTN